MKIIAILTLLLGLYSCGQNNDQKNFESNMDEINNTPPIGVPEEAEKSDTVMIQIYNNGGALIEALSQNGIGKFGEASVDFGSNTFSVDSEKRKFGKSNPQSEISYLIEGENEVCQSVSVLMKIHSKSDRKEGAGLFKKMAEKTCKTVGIVMPLPIFEAIGYGKSKSSETKSAIVTFKVDKGEIEKWVFKITTK